jgi:hypothetical protein
MKLDKSNIPYGILLVYDNFNAIKFDSRPLLVDSNLEQAIIDGLLYMVVFRSEINGVSAYSYYEKLHDPFKYKKYVLKGFGVLDSLSRCDSSPRDSSSNFRPDLFKITKPSPGQENICDESVYLLDVMTTNILISETEIEITEGGTQEPVNDSGEKSEEPQMTCSTSSAESIHISNILRNEKTELNDSSTNEWDSTCYFQSRWIKLIKDNQNDLISTDTIQRPEIKKWFQYNYNEDVPRNSTFSCRLCLKYSSGLYNVHQQIPKIASEEGYLIRNRADSKKMNNEYIRNHDRSSTHTKVVEILKNRKRESMPQLMLQMQRKKMMK